MPYKRSPLLAKADRAACYFDRRRKPNDRAGGGRWVSSIRVGPNIYITEFATEAEARGHVGLKGGSKVAQHRPEDHESGYEVSKG